MDGAKAGRGMEWGAGWGHPAAMGFLALVVLALTLPFVNRDVVNSLEVGYAVTAQETVRDGHWIVPMQNGLPRLYKPPLPFWVGRPPAGWWGSTMPHPCPFSAACPRCWAS